MTLAELIHRNLVMIHKRSGLKKSFIADQLGISKGAATHFYSGRRPIPYRRLEELAKIYGITEMDFIKLKKKR